MRGPVEDQTNFLASGSYGEKLMMWPHQTPVNYIMDVVPKFCEAFELALDTGKSTYVAVKSYLQPLWHRCFVGCVKDSQWVLESLPSFVNIFAQNDLDAESYSVGNMTVTKFCNVLVKAMKAVSSWRTVNSGVVLAGLLALQTFHESNMQIAKIMYKYSALNDEWRHIHPS